MLRTARSPTDGSKWPSTRRRVRLSLTAASLALAVRADSAAAQESDGRRSAGERGTSPDSLGALRPTSWAIAYLDSVAAATPRPPPIMLPPGPRTRADSAAWIAARAEAVRAEGFRVVVSLFERQLWVIADADTLRAAPVGVGTGALLEYEKRIWRFDTPRGRRTVLGKDTDPVWIPPDWHYVEVARERNLRVAWLPPTGVALWDGSRLEVRDGDVGVVRSDSIFAPLPAEEEIIFNETLFIPPVGTKNRRVVGELGRYRLDLGDGYLLHGTPYGESIGQASTHGCIRLRDEDIEWLYNFVPLGTAVYIY